MAFCAKCGAYIADGSTVCPACGKRVGQPEPKIKKEKSARGGAQARQAPEAEAGAGREQRSDSYDSRAARNEKRAGDAHSESNATGNSAYNTYNHYYNTHANSTDAYSYKQRSSGRHYSSDKYHSSDSGEYRYSYRKATDDEEGTAPGMGDDGLFSSSRPRIALLSYFGLLFLVPYFLRHDSDFARFHANQGLLMMLCGAASSAVFNLPVLGWLAGIVGWGFTISCFFQGINNVLKGRFRELPVIGKIRLLK